MAATFLPMPQYEVTQKICALQIAEIKQEVRKVDELPLAIVTFVEPGYAPLELLPSFITQYNPKAGGYLVGRNNKLNIYMDQKVFESMHEKVEPPSDTTLLTLPWESLGQPLYQIDSLPFLQSEVDFLWTLLDSIARMSNLYPDNDKVFRAECEQLLNKRARHISSDGSCLYAVKK